jgi:hypothetical protein
MKFTAPCASNDGDALVAYSSGPYVILSINSQELGGEASVVLTLDQIKQLDAELDAHVEAYSPKPTPVSKGEPQYTRLSGQSKMIYRHMDRAGSISAREAMDDYGITSATLARRICDIEEEGFEIWRDRLVHPITGKRYTRYSLLGHNA